MNGRTCVKEIYDEHKPEELIENKPFGYLLRTEPDLTIDQIIPNLYLSGDDVAQDYDLLRSKSITHILNLTTNVACLYANRNIKYKHLIVYDLPHENILKHFTDAFEFMNGALFDENQGVVLVHCNAGVSRSSAFVIGYLMTRGVFKSYSKAYTHVKQCRNKVSPNHGFVSQLKRFESILNGSIAE